LTRDGVYAQQHVPNGPGELATEHYAYHSPVCTINFAAPVTSVGFDANYILLLPLGLCPVHIEKLQEIRL
jgi:hypothetical protein